jgi:hypothetical protein
MFSLKQFWSRHDGNRTTRTIQYLKYSSPLIVLRRAAPYVDVHRQGDKVCPRTAQRSVTYRSPRFLQWQPGAVGRHNNSENLIKTASAFGTRTGAAEDVFPPLTVEM